MHRWLGLVIGLQVIAWSVGGAYFAWVGPDEVHGDRLRREVHPPAVDLSRVRPPQGEARALRLVVRAGRPAWEVVRRNDAVEWVDAESGAPLPDLTEEEARAIVAADWAGPEPIESMEFVVEAPGEYRGQPLPAWRAHMGDRERTRIYVDARSGAIEAYRTDTWRWWDFLWMLHIMDYRDRSDFHTPWLFAAAIVSTLTAMSGLALWGGRVATRFAKRRRS